MSDDGMTAGMLLRRAREAQGLHVAALAVSLKVPVRKVEALEEDRYDMLTDAVFVRALASSICRTLKIDPQPVLDRLPQTTPPRLARVADGINANFRAPNDGAPPSWLHQLTRPVFLAVFGLLLAALVVVLLPAREQESTTAEVPSPATPSLPIANVPVDPSVSLPAPDPAATAAESPAVAAPVTPAPVAAPATPAPVAPAPVSPARVADVPAPAVAATSTVIFKAKAPSWVEVTDAKGAVAVRKVLAAGEAAGASGEMPLRVTIGKVDSTEVQVRGKAFDLRPVSRDNVARFEVK
jgi:cytoskeleton protein RodZ